MPGPLSGIRALEPALAALERGSSPGRVSLRRHKMRRGEGGQTSHYPLTAQPSHWNSGVLSEPKMDFQ